MGIPGLTTGELGLTSSPTGFELGADTVPIVPGQISTREVRENRSPARSFRDFRLPRVLHVINGEHFSGAERVQQLLGKRLGGLGFDPLFTCLKPGRFNAACQLRMYQLFQTPMHGRWDLSVVQKVVELAQEQNVVLLHAHTPRTALVTSMAVRRLNLPWIYHVHSPTTRDTTRPLVNRMNAWVERVALRKCNLVLTVSRSLEREMLLNGVPQERLMVVPNGVPSLERIDAEARSRQDRWRLGVLALMRPRKGIEVALEALRLVRAEKPNVTLDLVGQFETPAYQRKIVQSIRKLGLGESVRCTGFTDDIDAAIHRLDALLLPSLFGEGMPMVALESISAGVPVIASSVEGTPEVIRDGIEGFLAQPGDARSLAQKICLLTDCRSRWQRLSRQAVSRHRSRFLDLHMAQGVAHAYHRVGVPAGLAEADSSAEDGNRASSAVSQV